jgi:hypothetical protein
LHPIFRGVAQEYFSKLLPLKRQRGRRIESLRPGQHKTMSSKTKQIRKEFMVILTKIASLLKVLF